MPTYFGAAAHESSHDRPFATQPRVANLRSQVAVVRALADQVEHVTREVDVDGLAAQIVEELGRLGHRLLDTAAALDGGVTVKPAGS
jgi:hypothetical protein